jgi:hypothetical protein
MIGDLRNLIATQPFVPFTLYLSDGSKVRVSTPEIVAVGPGGQRLVVFDEDGSTVIISSQTITRIVVDPEAAASGTVV